MTIPESYPSIARAYRSLADELRSLKIAHRQLQKENLELRDSQTDHAAVVGKLDDLKAERDNMYSLLRDAGQLNAALTKELDLAMTELDRLRDNNAELDERRLELEGELSEQVARVAQLESALDVVRADKDLWKLKYNAAVTR